MTTTLLALGEVRTALLMNSAPLAPTGTEALLDIAPGTRVRSAERPSPARFPPTLCTLWTAGRAARPAPKCEASALCWPGRA
ncbi:hypothetical protein ACU686_41685 [Yinghuangia aomiensis]